MGDSSTVCSQNESVKVPHKDTVQNTAQDVACKDRLIVDEVTVTVHTITVAFTATGKLNSLFTSTEFVTTYSENIENLPPSIAVVPFLSNVAPLVWIFDGVLEVDEVDADFYACLDKIKSALAHLYTYYPFFGSIECARQVKNTPAGWDVFENHASNAAVSPQGALALFSGGLDSYSTLIARKDEHPYLATVWGGDVLLRDGAAWDLVWQQTLDAANVFGAGCGSVASNFKSFLNERLLDRALLSYKPSPHEEKPYRFGNWCWWYDVQHGLGLLGLSAPLAFVLGARVIYIAATCAQSDPEELVCASFPDVDNCFRCAGVTVTHDGFERNRQDKANQIVNYTRSSKQHILLRVCYSSHDGCNCARCEKCGRTILGILAAGGNPADFGFSYTPAQFKWLMWKMQYYIPMAYPYYYRDIAQGAQAGGIKLPKQAQWVFSDNLAALCDNPFKRALWALRTFAARIYHCVHGR